MLCVEELLKLELFQQLPESRLNWICDRAESIKLTKGEILVKEGDIHRGFFLLFSGDIGITRFSEGIEIPVGQHQAPAFFGEIQILTGDLVPVTLRALTDCRLYEITGEEFLIILHECRNFERTIFQTVQKRLRGLESFIRNREKMAALGTLAAGLAHELNNPAAAVIRSLQDLIPAILELERMNLVYGQRNVEKDHTEKWQKAREDGYSFLLNNRLESLTLMDREDALLDWLEDYGVKDAGKLVEPLAAANIQPELLEELLSRWRDDSTELRDMGIRWLALSFDVMMMIQSGLRGAERVSELVKSMRSYSHLDQGAKQRIDIHQGIEDTLQLLSHKLKQGIKVNRVYDRTLPQIPAYGSELNQVWTNLIDNAIDAMDGKGTIEITTVNKWEHIIVKITDSGTGIPETIQSRIFEPFFTTKPIGKGSGLGLELVRRIVENRHRGSISVESEPGKTCFKICLPTNSENSQASTIA
ncbi:MAG: ATP-binding protein [Xenococcaceae cyanobacterium MO_167.B27]|nr:ATP-binding protein [Xenococcaceae cyanobacterium MO_167.B27]